MEIASIFTLAAGMALAGSAFAPAVSPGTRLISAILGLALSLLAVVLLFIGASPGIFLWIIAVAFAVRNFRAADRRQKKIDAGQDPVRHPNLGDLRQLQLPAWAPQVPGVGRQGVPGVARPGTPAGPPPGAFRGQAASYATSGQAPGHNAAPDTRGLRPAPATDRWGKPIPPGSMMDRWGNIVPGE
ncbi:MULTISPECIES: hypothetical protein [unclassified Arthrobacter]|uniref:hypothetical protein n=1 Tax=unclassified Arthrobacter TaxID=235627 RepID=UPI001490F49A|nr:MULTISPECIES: hypothetical protein [unclassified Arthrobacter]MBE0008945.1 hypothetical protein [Arthrobacter sp. AET 35A]NOJ60880.1 hypothetical protein [Arthrobacter sp. 260]NOJ62926.1 hypothetical protein [Arthrobacter sp. 147(2020)]